MNASTWTPTPKYLLRWACIEDLSRQWSLGRFIEMGAGTGGFTARFLRRGFQGVCYDLGSENRSVLRSNLQKFESNLEVIDDLVEAPAASFDYLFAFEVLEHIEHDADALRQWHTFLKPGGRLLISVPAHMDKFDQDDEAMGHYRRYEREELRSLLADQGFEKVKIVSYGFPLGNITRNINRLLTRLFVGRDRVSIDSEVSADRGEMTNRSQQSGIGRTSLVGRCSFLFNEWCLWPFLRLQRAFYKSDWGDGYIATAAKR